MAKNFENANSINLIKNVAKTSNETANVIQVKMIKSENLMDYPKNNEDIENTADLEKSMQEIGFTDPIEVTNFNMPDGKYMIVSGHRRRCAGVKIGIETFPCIIKSFENEHELRNCVLLSNAQRDSAKDPLLFCKRYKMHEEYLQESGFQGSFRIEIAQRLGLSTQQADRYKQFNKIILPVWDLVREEIVGMSSVLGMACFTTNEQQEILVLLNASFANNEKLTRDVCERIINNYKNDIKKAKQKAKDDTQKKKEILKHQIDEVDKNDDDDYQIVEPIKKQNQEKNNNQTKEIETKIENFKEATSSKVLSTESEEIEKSINKSIDKINAENKSESQIKKKQETETFLLIEKEIRVLLKRLPRLIQSCEQKGNTTDCLIFKKITEKLKIQLQTILNS
ncbi:MAG: ParB N-terminal domain-containing protein [Oscillospiraceae bacterium]